MNSEDRRYQYHEENGMYKIDDEEQEIRLKAEEVCALLEQIPVLQQRIQELESRPIIYWNSVEADNPYHDIEDDLKENYAKVGDVIEYFRAIELPSVYIVVTKVPDECECEDDEECECNEDYDYKEYQTKAEAEKASQDMMNNG